ncbi:hypothetical protein JZ751_026774 [Albula glossodonta]|uniref:Uncharacterized protein n=1 Tax=Albula glossodonta TaxID=121402 RepID=A0A8T2PCY8_9TELE|nr:hypothetical protein JZ751_026774 [Albula glossodonta]
MEGRGKVGCASQTPTDRAVSSPQGELPQSSSTAPAPHPQRGDATAGWRRQATMRKDSAHFLPPILLFFFFFFCLFDFLFQLLKTWHTAPGTGEVKFPSPCMGEGWSMIFSGVSVTRSHLQRALPSGLASLTPSEPKKEDMTQLILQGASVQHCAGITTPVNLKIGILSAGERMCRSILRCLLPIGNAISGKISVF